jgi:hypothetical protein
MVIICYWNDAGIAFDPSVFEARAEAVGVVAGIADVLGLAHSLGLRNVSCDSIQVER